MKVRVRLLALGAVVMLVVPFFWTSAAHAHTGNQSYVYLEIFDTAIAGRVEYPIRDLNRILGLDIPIDEPETLESLEANADVIQAYTAEHLAIGPEDGLTTWPYEFEDIELLDLGGGSYAVFNFEIQERFDPPPRTFRVSYDAIIEADSDRDGFLLIATDWGSGTFNNEANEFLRFSQGDTTHLVELDDTAWWKGVSGVVELGAEHIRIGTDHILFVLALVLPSVLVFVKWRDDPERRWHPSASFGSSLWRVLKIVTMFTVAHSITLALGGLGIVELSPRLVETIIALSIAAAALHNLHPIFVNKEWVLAFGFGLFHGFGFAGLLSELGLDRSNRFPSLLGFNVGVELGQSAIILMIFPMLFL
ncbi:MAG: HupE/UreJ family protein, partial [Acidimicrobiales bacterium]